MQFKWHDPASLRQLAEEAIVGVSLHQPTDRSERLLHDLLVHKTELEMQNEALSEAQVELQCTHERYKALFEKAPMAYVALDPGCRITAANTRAARLLGKSPDDLIGERLNSYLLPDEAIPFERYRREIRRAPASLTAEFTMVVAGGEQREIRVESVAIGEPNSEWCVALTDVTEHNELLRKLDHAERLEAVQHRASTIAHSLHNLLFGIVCHAEVALHFVEPDAPAHAPLLHLLEVVKRCSAATEQLTAFSRAESERPVIVDLHAAISEMASILPSLLGEDIEVELRLEAPDATVRLSPAHIEQIVLTAARNARHAMPHGGSFRIETANVELAGNAETGGAVGTRFLRWTVSDTGIGMTDSTRSRAFEPFFTTKPPGVGTGLGLSMVKAAVERSGGMVALESELGRGTHLVIHLPRATGTSYFPPAPGEATGGESA
jgi:two-component system cell cycle sensor histidine kinase/response regulator CckA